MPTCWIIAKPNGAGKTTFALSYLLELANCSRFINANLIAAGFSLIVIMSMMVREVANGQMTLGDSRW